MRVKELMFFITGFTGVWDSWPVIVVHQKIYEPEYQPLVSNVHLSTVCTITNNKMKIVGS